MTQAVPSFILYGEDRDIGIPDFLHCESIRARCSLHGWEIKPHRHNDLHQLIFVRKGPARVSLDGQLYALEGPLLAVLPPLVVHGFACAPETDGVVVTAPGVNFGQALQAAPGLADTLAGPMILTQNDGVDFPELAALFARLVAEFEGDAPGRIHALRCLLGLIAVWVGRAAGTGPVGGMSRSDARRALFNRFQVQVGAGYREHRTVADYAAELAVTPTHLNRICRAIAGKPASKVIHDRLMLEARRNLVYTSMTVAEVSHALGFSDPAYFSRFFAKRAGQSPHAFRTGVLTRLGDARGETA